MQDVLVLMGCGFAMGFFGSIPLTGPIAVMAINRAVDGDYLHGFLVGVGGTCGELIYCGLAVAGVGAMIDQLPHIRQWIRAFSALLLLGVGFYFLYNTPEEGGESFEETTDSSSLLAAFGGAFSVAAFNPVLLLNWTAAVALVFSYLEITPVPWEGAAFVGSVGMGVISWYAVLMSVLRRYRQNIPTELLAWAQRIMSVFVIAGALYLGFKATVDVVA